MLMKVGSPGSYLLLARGVVCAYLRNEATRKIERDDFRVVFMNHIHVFFARFGTLRS